MSENGELSSLYTSYAAEETVSLEGHGEESESLRDLEEEKEGVELQEGKTAYLSESQYDDLNKLITEQVFNRSPSTSMTPAILRQIISNELERMKGMKPAEFVEKMEELKHLHEQIYEAAEKLIKQVVAQIPFLTPIFKHLSEYDQKTLDKALEATDEEWENAGISPDDRETLLNSLKDRMVESVNINFDFTHRISYIASPLTVWRLSASTAVWAGNKELTNAYQTTRFQLDDTEAGLMKGTGAEEEADKQAKKQADEAAKLATLEAERLEREREIEAVERARLEAEMYIEGQLNPDEIAASERPPLKEWIKFVYTSGEGDEKRVICYVRAPSDCLVSEDRLVCTYASPHAEWPNLPGNAEVIGNFVCIRPQHPKLICILPNEPWIIGIPHNYGKNPTKEVVVFTMESGDSGPEEKPIRNVDENDDPGPLLSPWIDLQTTDVSYEDSRYLEFKLMRLSTSLVFAPATRIRRDIGEFGRSGGKLTSLVDKRVTLVIPPGALKISCTYSIQVQPISQHHAQILRDQNLSFMSQFTSSGPLVILNGPKKILYHPALITLPVSEINPSDQVVILSNASMPEAFLGDKKSKVRTEDDEENESSEVENEGEKEDEEVVGSQHGLDPFQRSLLLPKLLAGANSSHSEVFLMWAGKEDSNWKIWDNGEFVETKDADIYSFKITRIVPRKFMAIQTRANVDNGLLIQMAHLLERSLSQRIVYAYLRQHNNDQSKVCFGLCLTQDLEKMLNQMTNKGFTEGGRPVGPLFVYERQQFDVALKGNIRLKKDTYEGNTAHMEGKGKMKLTFNSALPNEYTIDVEEFDSSAQVACEKYRGFVEISYKHLVKVPAKRVKNEGTFAGAKKYATELQTVLLCQLLITLPKREIVADVDRTTISYQFEANDAITNDLLKDLSEKLPGDTWKSLGAALSLTRIQLQAIGGRAEYEGKNKTLMMLRNWIKNLELKVDRVNRLKNALAAIGRSDLINDLYEIQNQQPQSQESTETPFSTNSPLLTTPPATVDE
ncbi:hypothetical protein Aperf_G00000005271 [Anoplocephala perfoliata]